MVSSEDVSVVDSLPPTDVPIDSEVVMTGLPGHVNPEAELYDSSPSPGSYYDTASESAPFPTTDNSQSTDYFISVSSDDKLHELEQVINKHYYQLVPALKIVLLAPESGGYTAKPGQAGILQPGTD